MPSGQSRLGEQRRFLRGPEGADGKAGGTGQVDLTRAVPAVPPLTADPAPGNRDGQDDELDGGGAVSPWRRFAAAARTRRGRVVLAVVVVVVVLAVVAVVVLSTVTGSAPTAAPTAPPDQGAASSSAVAPDVGTPTPTVDPAAPAATAFLGALRRIPVPVSTSGLPETEAAAVICEQLAAGTDRQTLVQQVPALLPTVPESRAGDVVAAASKTYC